MSFLPLSDPSLTHAAPDPQAVFQFPGIRFTLLTPRLLRIEFSPSDQFEDRPTQQFWYRRQPFPPAQVDTNRDTFSLSTKFLSLSYCISAGPGAQNPEIRLLASGASFHVDDPNPARLPGTARTLDETNGPIDLKPGLISRSGWVIIDDTPSLVFNSGGWLEPRPEQPGYRDLYLLVSEQDYKAALIDYQLVAGKPSLVPRPMLGNWWSRYWEYSQDDIQALVERFRKEQIPLSVYIIDMDWHITKTGNACSGWTGFTWNRDLFPDPPALLSWLHDRQLMTSLNLHPAEGIHPHEEGYPRAARLLGVDPATAKPVPFEISDPTFARVYFEEILHPLEEQGVDFWWIDWQQGMSTLVPGLDPLWWLNHLHFFDLGRTPAKRPVVFSRWGGPGNHRYPIGFSGDTVVSWKSLAYQPYFSASAANVAYGWWSHDIGGHMGGMEDGELYTRWVQFGVLSPIFRLHCTKDPFQAREPWVYDGEVLSLARRAMQFRHALVPYLYTLAKVNEQEGIPPVLPLYYDWPSEDAATLASGQYLLGSQLMAAPVTAPRDPDTNRSRKVIWFPPGEWFHFFTGEPVSGPQWKIEHFRLSDIPLYARAGTILPLQADLVSNGCSNPQALDVIVFPGASGSFELYEDDGVTQANLTQGGCQTVFRSRWTGSSLSIEVLPVSGELSTIPARRRFRFLFRGVDQPDGCRVSLDGIASSMTVEYDPASRTAVVGPAELSVEQSLQVEIFTSSPTLLSAPGSLQSIIFELLKDAHLETPTKGMVRWSLERQPPDLSIVALPSLKLTESQIIAIAETFTGAGAVRIDLPEGGSRVVLLNPHGWPGFMVQGRELIETDRGGTILPQQDLPLQVNYFGLIRKYL